MDRKIVLQQLSTEVYLNDFATWLESEGFKAIGYNMWSTSQYNYWYQPMYYTTEQLVKRFLKDK